MNGVYGNGENNQILVESNARLKGLIARMAKRPGRTETAVEGLVLTRWNDTARTDTCFYAPSIGLVSQGCKEAQLGSGAFRYGELACVVNGVEMPSINRILEASPEFPMLAVSLNIDKAIAMELASKIPPTSGFHDSLGVSISTVTLDVLKAFTRLIELLDKPEQLPLRAPILVREIITRVLLGPQGPSLRMIYTTGTTKNQIAEVVSWLRHNYVHPLNMESLVKMSGMPTTTFYRQFKKVTSLSPLQYQKCLQLYEAQRLMLNENMDANNAGRVVGYELTQQFNREYKRLFGEPPLRHIKKLRAQSQPKQGE